MSDIDQATETASSAFDQAKTTAGELVGKAQSVASDYAGRAKDAAANVAGQAKEYAGAAKSKAGEIAGNIGTHPFTDTTAKIPTEAFIVAAGASIAGSLVLKFLGRHKDAEFIGHWAPTLISLGLLSKLIEHTRQPEHDAERTPSGENL